jgi:hypothetical protein
MSVFNACNAGVFTKLAGGTALVGSLGGTAIYYLQAPEGAALPYVVFSLQAGGPLNVNPSDMRDEVYFVRAYASTPGMAGTIDAQCSALLHRQALSVSGYTNIWTARESDLALVENPPSGRPVFMAGGLYRIKIDS